MRSGKRAIVLDYIPLPSRPHDASLWYSATQLLCKHTPAMQTRGSYANMQPLYKETAARLTMLLCAHLWAVYRTTRCNIC